MRQEILDRDFALCRHHVESNVRRRSAPLPGSSRRLIRQSNADFQIFKLGNEFRNRIVEADFPFLDHHHDCHAHHRFRHRHDAEHGIRRHRFFCFDIHQALRLQVRDTAIARDQRDRARETSCVEMPQNQLVNPVQPFGRDADIFRFRPRHFRHNQCADER